MVTESFEIEQPEESPGNADLKIRSAAEKLYLYELIPLLEGLVFSGKSSIITYKVFRTQGQEIEIESEEFFLNLEEANLIEDLAAILKLDHQILTFFTDLNNFLKDCLPKDTEDINSIPNIDLDAFAKMISRNLPSSAQEILNKIENDKDINKLHALLHWGINLMSDFVDAIGYFTHTYETANLGVDLDSEKLKKIETYNHALKNLLSLYNIGLYLNQKQPKVGKSYFYFQHVFEDLLTICQDLLKNSEN